MQEQNSCEWLDKMDTNDINVFVHLMAQGKASEATAQFPKIAHHANTCDGCTEDLAFLVENERKDMRREQ